MCSQDKVIGEARAAGAIITDESSSYDDNKNGYFFSFLTSSSHSPSNEVLQWFLFFRKQILKFVPVWASWALELMIFFRFQLGFSRNGTSLDKGMRKNPGTNLSQDIQGQNHFPKRNQKTGKGRSKAE